MFLPLRSRSAPTRIVVGFTIRGTLTLFGRTVAQTQYVTEQYVITEVERSMFIFLADRDERFLVDRSANRLRRIDPGQQRIKVERLRSLVGDVAIETEERAAERNGFICRRHRFENANARIIISGETLSASIEGVEKTALQAEREHDATHQPFSLPLGTGEVVFESTLRTMAADFEQNQRYRLDSLVPGTSTMAEVDRIARMSIIA